MPRMTVELYDRRKQMLELYYSGVPVRLIIPDLADKYTVNDAAVRKDWQRRETWEPLIWQTESSRYDVEHLFHHLRLARERAEALTRSADSDSAKVGAIGKLIDIITTEIELRQSLGHIPRVADKLDISQDITVQRDRIHLEDYSDDEREALRAVARLMEQRAQRVPGADGAE